MGCTCTKPTKSDSQPKPVSRAAQYELKGGDDSAWTGVNSDPKAKNMINKKGQQPSKKILADIYLFPYLIAEMAYSDEAKFIKVIKENQVRNIVHIKGYEVQPQLILKSGRKVSTVTWNPLTFALVLGKQELYNFLVSEYSGSLKSLLEHEAQQVSSLSNQVMISENREADSLNPIFSLVIENESPLFKHLVNGLSYLLTNANLKSLISCMHRSIDPHVHLEDLLTSRIFKSYYYQKVKSIMKYKASFEMFFDKYLAKFATSKEALQIQQRLLVKRPYSAGFGILLITKYSQCKKLFEGNNDNLILQCSSEMKEFDVYRLGQIKDHEVQELQRHITQNIKVNTDTYNEFVNNLVKLSKQYSQVDQKVQTMLEKAQKGDLSGVKSKIGSSDIPREALAHLSGLKSPPISFKVQELNEEFDFEPQEMNVLELASAMGHHKIVTYLVEELQMKSSRDFSMQGKSGLVDSMTFLLGALFRKEQSIIKIILDQPHLWSYEEFTQIVQMMKQIKWLDGIDIALDSKTSEQLFLRSNLAERFRFIRDFLILPFKIERYNESVLEQSPSGFNESQRMSSRRFTTTVTTLTDQEKIKLRAQIKNRFTLWPYTAAYLFQEFAQRKDTYKEEIGHVIPENLDESLSYLRLSILNVTDIELHEYIYETQGSVINTLQRYVALLNDEAQRSYAKAKETSCEIQTLIQRIQEHPSTKQLLENEMNSCMYGGDDQI